jgi:plastocyanin
MRLALAAILVLSLALTAACGSGAGADAVTADAPPSLDLKIRAKASKFDKKTLVATANADVLITLDNQDSGALHNVAIYDSRALKEKVFAGELFPGKKTVEYRFRTPDAGSYYFRCDAHPDMNGAFIVKPASGQ